MTYLLDTNAWIVLLRSKNVQLRERFYESLRSGHFVGMSSVVLMELYQGAIRSQHPDQELHDLRRLAAWHQPMPFDPQCADIAGHIIVRLQRAGQPIGPMDTLIAATAIRYNSILVTHNIREFSRVEGLIVEDWEV